MDKIELCRKPDQFYFDQYDRRTIKRLTELKEKIKYGMAQYIIQIPID